ncbi:hypothetical protein BAE44_0026399 [Dichanthelium oligosanthes]|uniref:Uncharacterized protein n=1 Tax=Dichanthelium oligosanthes TaxID=888268 RepID=A0A1E5UI78_9POAL|nr:hypothetical protein BAE44_0026399 [Dichanthelium oligosanthes]
MMGKQPETGKKRETGAAVAAAGALPRSPKDKPPFTLADIRNAIPPPCFRRSLCGHGAFSDHPRLNDALGLLLHSALLVPYLLLLEVQPPPPPRQHGFPRPRRGLRSPPQVPAAVGWSMYLAFNTGGRAYPRWASHFDPYAPIYSDRERAQVALSDAGLLAASLALYALATVDRDYGALGRAFFHNIADTHVAHHLFLAIPHYHAVEAIEAIRPVLGEYYRFDPTYALRQGGMTQGQGGHLRRGPPQGRRLLVHQQVLAPQRSAGRCLLSGRPATRVLVNHVLVLMAAEQK